MFSAFRRRRRAKLTPERVHTLRPLTKVEGDPGPGQYAIRNGLVVFNDLDLALMQREEEMVVGRRRSEGLS